MSNFTPTPFAPQQPTQAQFGNFGMDTKAVDKQVNQALEEQKKKTLSKQQVSQIIQGAPEGTQPREVIGGLLERGFALEGMTPEAQKEFLTPVEADSFEVEEEVPEEKGALEKFSDFTTDVREGFGAVGEFFDDTIGQVSKPFELMAEYGGRFKAKPSERFDTGNLLKDTGFAAYNLLPDAVELVGEVGQAITNPIDTIKGLGSLTKAMSDEAVFGVLNKISGEDVPLPEDTQALKQGISQVMKENFGTVGKAKQTLLENPVDTLLILKGGLLAGSKISKSDKLAKLAKKVPDPITPQAKVAQKLVKGAGEITQETLGGVSGLGKEGVKQIFSKSRSPEFLQAFHGKTSITNVVDDVADAISDLNKVAGNQFKTKLDKIVKGSKVKMTNHTSRIDDFFKTLGDDAGVAVTKGKNGQYSIKSDLSTTFTPEDFVKYERITKKLNEFTKKKSLSPIEERNLATWLKNEAKNVDASGPLFKLKNSIADDLDQIVPG